MTSLFSSDIKLKALLLLPLPGAVGHFDGWTLTVFASTSRGGAVARPGAAQTGAHAVHAVVIVAGLPRCPGPETPIGGLVPQLEVKHRLRTI